MPVQWFFLYNISAAGGRTNISHKFLRYTATALIVVFAIALLAIAGVWLLGGLKINQKFETPTVEIQRVDNPEIISEGGRLATIFGCRGCHGDRMQGKILAELPDGSRLAPPNIPRIASSYTDEDLARAIRYGVRPDGTGVMAMPSDVYHSITDDDLVALVSYIRTISDEGGDLPRTRFGLMARFFLATGEFKSAPIQIGDLAKRATYDFNEPIEMGAYIATLACAECHGKDFKGEDFEDGFGAPDLIVGSAYTPDEFRVLMRTGVGTNGRDLGQMSEMGRTRFVNFTDEEIDALHAFILHRAMNIE